MMQLESVFDLLADDAAGYRLKQVHEELLQMRVAVRQAMDRGMTNDEAAAARRLLQAVDCADAASDKLHRLWHG